jgi:hypothetical protein
MEFNSAFKGLNQEANGGNEHIFVAERETFTTVEQ